MQQMRGRSVQCDNANRPCQVTQGNDSLIKPALKAQWGSLKDIELLR